MNQSLSGKTAFVTGGAGSIGSGCALRLLRDGAAVLIMGRKAEALEAAKSRMLDEVPAGRVETYAGDARSAEDVQAALQRASDIGGHLDILVPTVGGGAIRPLLLHDIDSFRYELDLNLVTSFLVIRYGAPLLPSGGSIVCISSTASIATTPWFGAYMAAKAGLDALVKAAAEELGSAGIRVNSVQPGTTMSEAMAYAFSDEFMKPILEQIPLNRTGLPIDTAEAVRYLAGPESSWVTGQSIAVDGGGVLRKNPDLEVGVIGSFGQEALDAVRRAQVPDKIPEVPPAMA